MRQFAVVLLLLTLTIPIPKAIGTTSHVKASAFPITPADLNGNGIDDILEHTVDSTVTVIAHYNGKLPEFLTNYAINYVFKEINAVKVELPRSQLQSIVNHKEITYLESNSKIKPYLLQSTAQMGLPGSFWENGITGSSQMSIAILDSGLDFTHTAFSGRIAASYNAINQNATLAMDNDGHGTHVAGIAAGAFDIQNDIYRESDVGKFSNDCNPDGGCYAIFAFQLPNIAQGEKVRILLDWASAGSSAGVYILNYQLPLSLACTLCQIESSTGQINQTVTLDQGSYLVGVYSKSGAANQDFEAAVEYKKAGLSGPGPDIKGVAYTTNIIPVKVLDGSDGGTPEVFDGAVKWVIDHRQEYNITVVNLSLGLDVYSQTLDSLMAKLVDSGILPVVAAGNSGPSSSGIFSPASAPEALTVGAINNIGEIAYYSNVGSNSINKIAPKPDVMAPGGSIASRILGFQTGYALGFGLVISAEANLGSNIFQNDMIGYQGTSMAAPHISGLASLVASQIQASSGWDWNSRASVMRVKRMIQTGTYEVGNIGLGREHEPSSPSNPSPLIITPPINRTSRDYQEGWGAVDASAVQGILSNKIDVGYTENLNFDLTNPYAHKTQGWYMTLQSGINYGFTLDVPKGYDLDLKVIDAENGPLLNNQDYGELQILASSTNGPGKNEGIALSVDHPTKVYVTATIVDGSGPVNSKFSVVELTNKPMIEINSPINGQNVSNPITVDYTATPGDVNLTLDGKDIGIIQSGKQLGQLELGKHELSLTLQDPSGILVSAKSTFTVVEKSSTTAAPLPNLAFFSISIMILVIFRFKYWHKFNM